MGWALVAIEVVIGACAGLLVLAILALFTRRRLIARRGEVSVAALRLAASPSWQLGLLRLTAQSLDFFPLVGVTTRPRWSWHRGTLELGHAVILDDSSGIDDNLPPGSVSVPFAGVDSGGGTTSAHVALPPAPYTAVRAWAEAAPPGEQPMSV